MSEANLEKSIFNELKTGFMSPSGDFYEAGYMEHLHIADELYESIHNSACVSYPEDELMKEGWLSIHVLTMFEKGYLFSFMGHLTSEQIKIIKPVVEDNWNQIIKTNRRELEIEFYGVCEGMVTE